MLPRLGAVRVFLLLALAILVLHFLASSLAAPDEYATQDPSWSEKLGLDHYADFEAGVTGRLGDGLGKVKEGLGVIRGGLGWAGGAKLGNLYELIALSNASPRPGYYDERTSFDRLRLTSTRVLGHGLVDPDRPPSELAEDAEDASLGAGARGSRNRRHILVTGGFGSLGKHVLRDMLLGLGGGGGATSRLGLEDWSGKSTVDTAPDDDVLITVLDVVDRTAELDHLLQAAPLERPARVKGTDPRTSAFTSSERSVANFRRSGKLRIVVGDVRDNALLKKLLAPGVSVEASNAGGGKSRLPNAKGHVGDTNVIPPVSGIVHLASYSASDCKVNAVDCESVETGGMTAMLKALGREGMEVSKVAGPEGGRPVVAERPWLVVARRAQGWADVPEAYNLNASSASVIASHDLLKEFSTHHPLHSLLLTLPSQHSFIGDPYVPRSDPIPHIVQSALAHLPIQIYTSPEDRNEAFIAAGDASRSIIQGARMLELASKKSYVRDLAFVAELEVMGPSAGSSNGVLGVAQTAISLTRSQSAIARHELPSLRARPDEQRRMKHAAVRKTGLRALGYTPTTTVATALKSYLSSMLRLQSTQLASKIAVACSSPPAIPVLEEGLLALSGCNVQLLTVIDGAYFTLGCSAGIEERHTTPVAVLNAVPFKEGVRGVEILAERGLEGKVDLQMKCPVVDGEGKSSGMADVVVWTENLAGGAFAEASRPGVRAIAEWYSIDFVQRDARAFTMTLPPTEGVSGDEPKRRLTLRDPSGSARNLQFQSAAPESKPLLWRVNPICCPGGAKRKDVWDFFKEDPVITSQVTYPSEDGRTSLTESTLAIQRCRDLRVESESIVALQSWLHSPRSAQLCVPSRGEASGWAAKDLTICSIDCGAPLVCLASDKCKCTRDRCGDARALGPFPSLAYSDRLSFAPVDTPRPSLAERVAQIPWDAVVLPSARRAFNTPVAQLPKAHVVKLPDTIDTHLKSEACFNVDKSPLPFMGDHILIEALRNQSVFIDEADFVMLPYYQGCYYNYLQENTFKKLADTIAFAESRIAAAEQITASRIVIPFTHDFGSCTGWWPRLEDLLGRTPPSPMDQAVAWQVNGDYNTRCIKTDRDVVIPALTKHTKALAETFGSLSSVKPVTERAHLAFFAGGVRGFGAIARTRIGCGRVGETTSKILYQKFAPGQRYLGTLNSAKFCLLPRGIPAWTTRTFEAIYAGCIPVFIVDRNIFPFQDILDYSLFSVTVPENEAHRVEEILETYGDETLFELQAHLLKVREAFLFQEGREWERKGPLFFSLVSMQMRLELQYPAVASCLTTQ